MASSDEDAPVIDGYLQAVGNHAGGCYSLKVSELSSMLAVIHQLSSLKVDLLKAVQSTLTLPKKESPETSLIEELKGALTNAIIMQTRVNEKGQELVQMLNRCLREGVIDDVPIGRESVVSWGRVVAETYRQMERRGT